MGYGGPDISLLVNNQTAIKMINNLINHSRVKYINIFYYYVQNKVKKKVI